MVSTGFWGQWYQLNVPWSILGLTWPMSHRCPELQWSWSAMRIGGISFLSGEKALRPVNRVMTSVVLEKLVTSRDQRCRSCARNTGIRTDRRNSRNQMICGGAQHQLLILIPCSHRDQWHEHEVSLKSPPVSWLVTLNHNHVFSYEPLLTISLRSTSINHKKP